MLGENFWSKVDKTVSDCWLWTGAKNSKGYGCFAVAGRSQLAHRVAYEELVGSIPDGLQIDHLCRIKSCVNPAHLEPVTALENMNRRPDVNKPECIHGHALTPENTIVRVRKNGSVMRNCRTCTKAANRIADRRRYAERLAKQGKGRSRISRYSTASTGPSVTDGQPVELGGQGSTPVPLPAPPTSAVKATEEVTQMITTLNSI